MKKNKTLTAVLLIFMIPAASFAVTDYDQKKNNVKKKYLSIKPNAWGMYINGVKTHIKTDKRIIALTFDACGGSGGKKFDADLIKFLKDNKIKATLFVTTSWISYNRKAFTDLINEPLFDIQNHGHKHKPASVTGATAWKIKGTIDPCDCFDEVEKSASELQKLTGKRPLFYRSGTAYYDNIAVKIIRDTDQIPMNFSGVIADADPKLSLETVKKNIWRNVKNGAVMIMHFNHPGGKTYPAVKTIVPELVLRGYGFVTLSEVADQLE